MRAAVLEHINRPLALVDAPDPVVGRGEVIVRVRTAGICRTDLKIIEGGIPTVATPRILGHEPAGEVVELGAHVDDVRIGDRVAVSLDVSCLSCAYCVEGRLDHCARLQRIGFERDGGLAEYLAVPAGNLVPLDDRVSFEVGATLPDAVGSSFHAVVGRAKVRAGETVVVNGLGGLGLCAVQIAAACGARVIAVARHEGRRALARELGAFAALDPRDELVDRLKDRTQGLGVHAFLDFVGTDDSLRAAVLACRKGGRVVVVGYVAPELRAAPMDLVYREVSITGSRGSTRAELRAAARLVADGRITPVVGEVHPLSSVNSCLDSLRAGDVVGRIIITP